MKNNENLEKLKDLISKSPFGYVKTLKGKSNAFRPQHLVPFAGEF